MNPPLQRILRIQTRGIAMKWIGLWLLGVPVKLIVVLWLYSASCDSAGL